VAQSQGEMGYLLEQALVNHIRREKLEMPVACVLTQVLVDPDDPAFEQPTKPIGPFFNRYRASLLRREGKAVVEDSGRGYRRVVASPRPQQVLGLEAVRLLLDRGGLVIAGGGGGVPVVANARGQQGVEAVIDKDYTAGMMARELGAGLLAILTDVDQVCLDYGTAQQKELRTMSANQARAYLDEGQFPPGSMGPKVETALEFVESTGGEVLITSIPRLAAAMAGRSGTRLTPSNRLPFNGESK
jgi:carbamate kinase